MRSALVWFAAEDEMKDALVKREVVSTVAQQTYYRTSPIVCQDATSIARLQTDWTTRLILPRGPDVSCLMFAPSTSEPSSQKQHEENYHDESQASTGVVTPRTAIRPSRQCSNQQQDQNN
jgi:hypothetical protein